MDPAAVKVVLDTNTLLSAIGWTGPPAQILTALVKGEHNLVISPPLLEELSRVLSYPRLRQLSALPSVPLILAWIHRPEHIVIPSERINAIPSDPADNLVLEAAVAGKAGAIVSDDQHLRRLTSFRRIPILTARGFVTKYL